MARVAVVWRAPFTTCQQLELLPGAAPNAGDFSWPYHASSDGNTIVGWAADASGNQVPVKWIGTSVTTLASVPPAKRAVYCLPDASIIIGDGGPNSSIVRWTGGGTSGALLSGSSYLQLPFQGAVSMPARLCSDDGSAIIGTNVTTSTRATRWDSTVPTALPPQNPGASTIGICCSADGSVVLGTEAGLTASYWTGTTVHNLIKDPVSPITHDEALACNSNGSVVWGTAGSPAGFTQPCYWDSLATVSVGNYGVLHFLNGIATIDDLHMPTITGTAETTTAIAVGSHNSHGVRWNGVTPTDLGILSGGNSIATGCSATGARVCGYGTDAAGTYWAIYWDDTNTLHQLPTLPNVAPGEYVYKGQGWGMSRDGSTIFGIVQIEDGSTPPPDPPPRLAMDDVVVTATTTQLSRNLISLSWSNDRGHSFGSPVTQSIGEVGEYRTSLQWNRLEYSRDRVFKLEWSVPMKTALLGAYIDVTPAGS